MGQKIYNLERMIEAVYNDPKISDKTTAIAKLVKHANATYKTSPIYHKRKTTKK